ncbi:hypothetical protein P5673_017246 [Acropora cervicornis]|uniref:Uncharacterized protein n=1 Tax=Acropora cervicornis TaxID=6130 RepID=A0AAD9QFE1_ACRCE|nr:hypothetical protein P5673_017246 [Acropora cervicornis]
MRAIVNICIGMLEFYKGAFPRNSEMVSAMLEAGCHKNAKMGIPATITPLNLATELGLKDIICQLS